MQCLFSKHTSKYTVFRVQIPLSQESYLDSGQTSADFLVSAAVEMLALLYFVPLETPTEKNKKRFKLSLFLVGINTRNKEQTKLLKEFLLAL